MTEQERERMEQLRRDVEAWRSHAKKLTDHYQGTVYEGSSQYHDGRETAYAHALRQIDAALDDLTAAEEPTDTPTPQPAPTLPEQWRKKLDTVLEHLDHLWSEAKASERRYYEDNFPKLHNYHHGSRLAYEVVREALQPLKALADAAPTEPSEPTSEPTTAPEEIGTALGEQLAAAIKQLRAWWNNAGRIRDSLPVGVPDAIGPFNYQQGLCHAYRDVIEQIKLAMARAAEAPEDADDEPVPTTEPDPDAVPGFVRLHANRGEVLVNVSSITAVFREGDDSIIICSGGFERAVSELPAEVAAAIRAAKAGGER